MAQIWRNSCTKANPGENVRVAHERRFCAGTRHLIRFQKGFSQRPDVAYMSQIGDIFDIVQQNAKSIP